MKIGRKKVCLNCIHAEACAMWNIGTIIDMDASSCRNYTEPKDSNEYLLGYEDGKREAAKLDIQSQ